MECEEMIETNEHNLLLPNFCVGDQEKILDLHFNSNGMLGEGFIVELAAVVGALVEAVEEFEVSVKVFAIF